MVKSDVLDLLREGVCEVSFLKLDGTVRNMKATLNADYLPPTEVKESTTSKPRSEDAIAVYDVTIGDWRSFRWDRLQTVDGVSFVN